MGATKRKFIRKLRHWKQRFDPNADFICRRPMVWDDQEYEIGDVIPEGLKTHRTKLRNFWETNRIELAEFEEPNVATGQVERPSGSTKVRPATTETTLVSDALDIENLPEGVLVTKGKGNWFIVNTPAKKDLKVNGQKALDKLLGELRVGKTEHEKETDDPDDWLV